MPTGHARLDAALPGGGWPCANLSEIVYVAPGVGELQLAMPLLARLTQAKRPLALIAPPHLPYAPALRQHGVALSKLTVVDRSEEHTSELQSLMRISYAVFCLKKNKNIHVNDKDADVIRINYLEDGTAMGLTTNM